MSASRIISMRSVTILVRRSKSFYMSHIVGNLIEEIKTFDERYISIITPI